MNPDYPLGRHTGGGRYPAKKLFCEADKTMKLARWREKYLIIWIPA
jgi:hypothetical protein